MVVHSVDAVNIVSVVPCDTFVGVVVVTGLVFGVGAVGGFVGVWVIHHGLNVLVVTSDPTLSPETDGEVGIAQTNGLHLTSARQTVG